MLSDLVSYIIQDELFIYFSGIRKEFFEKSKTNHYIANLLKIYIITSQFNFEILPYLKAGTRYMRYCSINIARPIS